MQEFYVCGGKGSEQVWRPEAVLFPVLSTLFDDTGSVIILELPD